MRLAGTRDRDIAATVGMPRGELAGRIAAIVAALGSTIPVGALDGASQLHAG